MSKFFCACFPGASFQQLNCERTMDKGSRATLRSLYLLIAFTSVLWIGYLILGQALIEWLYQGKTPFEFLNEIMTGRTFHPIERYAAFLRQLVVQLSVLALGAWVICTCWLNRARLLALLRGNAVLILVSFLVAILVSEALIRTALVVDLPGLSFLRSAQLYADPRFQQSWWQLHHRFTLSRDVFDPQHPLLGWSQSSASDDNPWGLDVRALQSMARPGRKKLLFYGDSFVHGMEYQKVLIPDSLNTRCPDLDAVNLGVRAYELDQVYLLFRETYSAASEATILIGILTLDIDRLLFQAREGQKPYFETDRGSLVLRGVPIVESNRDYFANQPTAVWSYALSSFWRLIDSTLGFEERRARKQKSAIAEFILEEIRNRCSEAQLNLGVVLFHLSESLVGSDWRADLVRSLCQKLEIQLIDTADSLLSHSVATGTRIEEFYHYPDQHHVDLANSIIAEQLADQLQPWGLCRHLAGPGQVDRSFESVPSSIVGAE